MKAGIVIVALGTAVVAGCASSRNNSDVNWQGESGPRIEEPAGAGISTNAVEPQARDWNQQPYFNGRPWGQQDQR